MERPSGFEAWFNHPLSGRVDEPVLAAESQRRIDCVIALAPNGGWRQSFVELANVVELKLDDRLA
jgi:hypothetical protein